MLNRKIAPEHTYLDRFEIANPIHIGTSNQIDLYAVMSANTDLVKLDLVFHSGSGAEPHSMYCSTALNMLEKGTHKRSADEIADIIENYGAYIQVNSSTDNSGVSLITQKKYFKETFEIYCEIILHPSFHQQELAIYLENKYNNHLINCQKTSFIASQNFCKIIFPENHPLAKFESESDFEISRFNQLGTYYQEQLLSSKKSFLITGNFDDSMIKSVQEFCQNEPLNTHPQPKNLFLHSEPGPLQSHIKKEESVQSSLRVGKQIHLGNSPSENARFRLLNTMLGGYFGSRLMNNLREKNGFTYGVGSSFIISNYGKYLVIGTDVSNQNAEKALNEMMYELKIILDGTIEKEEFERVKNYTIGSFLRGFDGPFSISEKFKSLLIRNLPHNYYEDYFNGLLQSQVDDLKELAVVHFQSKDFSSLIVGGN